MGPKRRRPPPWRYLTSPVPAGLRAAPFRCRGAFRKKVLKEDSLETLHRDGTTLCLRNKNGALERADDEACELLCIRARRQLPRIDRRFQAVGHRGLVLREHR